MIKITEFQGTYRFLSNFWKLDRGVVLDGLLYPTVEHAYVAAKTIDPAERERVLVCEKPGQAKRLGRTFTLRDDWEEVRLGIMEDLLRQKFTNNGGYLRDKLLQTRNAILEEGNHWGDHFWGVCDGVGENHLGKILMKIRGELLAAR